MKKRTFALRRWSPRTMLLVLAAIVTIGVGGGAVFARLGGAGTPAATGDVDLQKGLVGWWPLNGNTKDNTPYGDDCTNNSATLTTDRHSVASNAYSFNGTSSNLNCGSKSAFKQPNTFSISVWVNIPDNADTVERRIISTTESGGYALYLTGSSTDQCSAQMICFLVYAGGTWVRVQANKSLIPNNTWTHIVATYDPVAVDLVLYVNGAWAAGNPVGGGPAAVTYNATAPLCIGAEPDATTCSSAYFNGSIDDVRLYNRVISSNAIAALYRSYDGATKTDGGEKSLLGWWPLDGNAKDATPQANDGTLSNITFVADREGGQSSAASFNGSTSKITMATKRGLDAPTITVSAWVYPTVDTPYQAAVSRWSSSTTLNGDWMLGEGSSGSWRFGIYVGGVNTNVLTAANFSLNQWHHLVGTYDGSTLSIYVDGQLGATNTASGTLPSGADNLAIGSYTNGANKWTGSIDNVRIYGRVLSLSEISTLYKQYNPRLGLGGNPGSSINLQKGLIGYWPMNGNAKDATPHSNNGIVSGATLVADRKGRANSAYSFNGTSSVITVNDNTAYQLNGPFTVSFWYNDSGSSLSFPAIISKGNPNTSGTGWNIFYTPSNGHIYYKRDGNQTVNYSPASPPVTSTPSLFTLVNDGTNFYWYLNGKLGNTTASPGFVTDTTTSPLQFGVQGSSNYAQGVLDGVRIYNRALSATEVLALYNEYQ